MAQRMTKEELDEEFEQFLKESLSDDSFESTKKSSVLENLGRPKTKKAKPNKRDFAPRWSMEDDSDDGDVLTTSQSFLKSQRTSQPIEEEDEDEHIEDIPKPKPDPASISIERDSLEIDDSVVASGPNHTNYGIGLDTLEEQEEKERFFAKLERGASSTIDYSKLNKELDSTDSTVLTALICNKENPITEENENKEESKDLSENYSEDFEDDAAVTSPIITKENENIIEGLFQKNQGEEKTGMLAKVMLLDSMDSTLDTQKILGQVDAETESCTQQGTNDPMGTGVSNYTNSDIEALHQAYRHIDQSMEDTDEQKGFPKVTEHTNDSLGDTPNSNVKSLKPVSTVESDIPTVEELMQPIRGGLIYNMDSEVKPLSIIKPTDYKLPLYNENGPVEKALQSFNEERQHLDYLHEWNREKMEEKNPLTSQPELHYQSNGNLGAKGEKRPDYPMLHQQKRDRHDAMHRHHKDFLDIIHSKRERSPKSPLKKNQSRQYANVRSSGYGKVGTPLKQPALFENPNAFNTEKKAKSPPDGKRKDILSATKTIRFADSTPAVQKINRIDGSAQRYRERSPPKEFGKMETNMQHQRSTVLRSTVGIFLENGSSAHNDANLDVLQRLQNVELKINSEHLYSENLKAELTKKEDLLQKMEDIKTTYEKELNNLKQENYMLQTKLHIGEEKSKKRMHFLGDLKEPLTDEKLQQIQKEVLEQETLLHGYQQENERLYQQVKELQVKNKQNEERMFQENLSLKAALVSLREQMSKTAMQPQHPQHDKENSNFNELISELRALQKKEANLLEEINRYKQDKQALEVDLMQMRKERDLVKAQIHHKSGEKSYEMKIMEDTYRQEISQLNKRLQWFAENQELLDKDAARLRDAYVQIDSLKIQVEKLRQEAGNQSAHNQKRLKDKSTDAKRIQDLERQVKEMEGILRRRHPNSIPAIICAAAAVPDIDDKGSAKGETIAFLERRIKKLETDLENKDEEAKISLRSMEQQFQKIKIQYESRINDLERLLDQRLMSVPQKQFDNTSKLKTLEQELCLCKDAHQTTVTSLQKEIECLRENNVFLQQKERINGENSASLSKHVDEASAKTALAKLNQELTAKHIEVQELSKTVERLQRERMIMLSDKNIVHKADTNKYNSKVKKDSTPREKRNTTGTERFPGTLDEKMYQPGTFADFHISDVQQENDRLKSEVERLCLEINEQKTKYQHSLSRAEQSIQRILIKHLQKQVTELQKDRESLAVLHIREEALQKEITKLLNELKEAKECHSPGMKHFSVLENKIKHMEIRHSQREQELQQIIQQTRHVAEAEQYQEVDKWKKLAQQKNVELEKFRMELDSILDVLRVLQRQGVVIPASVPGNTGTTEVCWKA
ncbi:centrosomal protein of 162 kDa [Discoglossus pictus]